MIILLLTLLAIGDSTTVGIVSGTEAHPFTDMLAAENHEWNVINKGVSGQTTTHILERFDEDVLINHPDFVVVWAGQNDVNIGVSPAKVIENLKKMYEKVKRSGAELIAVEIPSYPMAKKSTLNDIMLINAWIKWYSIKNGNEFINFKNYPSIDGIHPIKEIYEEMARTIQEIIKIKTRSNNDLFSEVIG